MIVEATLRGDLVAVRSAIESAHTDALVEALEKACAGGREELVDLLLPAVKSRGRGYLRRALTPAVQSQHLGILSKLRILPGRTEYS